MRDPYLKLLLNFSFLSNRFCLVQDFHAINIYCSFTFPFASREIGFHFRSYVIIEENLDWARFGSKPNCGIVNNALPPIVCKPLNLGIARKYNPQYIYLFIPGSYISFSRILFSGVRTEITLKTKFSYEGIINSLKNDLMPKFIMKI